MSTMYSRSVVMLEQAKNALEHSSLDEAYLDIACFETQQAIEFLIKAILLENGKSYDKSHDIRYLLSLSAFLTIDTGRDVCEIEKNQ